MEQLHTWQLTVFTCGLNSNEEEDGSLPPPEVQVLGKVPGVIKIGSGDCCLGSGKKAMIDPSWSEIDGAGTPSLTVSWKC